MNSNAIVEREIYLIRHGESSANIAESEIKDLTEKADSLLTEKGVQQALALGRSLSGTEFSGIYASGLRRAVMTADSIAAFQKTGVKILPPLCEIGIEPEYNGLNLEQLKLLSGNVTLAEGYNDPENLLVPDETPGDFEERYFMRAGSVLDYCAKYTGGEKIALVSHAGMLTYIIFYILGYRDKEPAYDFRLSNTGITKILFYKPGTNKYGDIIFECVNDTAHLKT